MKKIWNYPWFFVPTAVFLGLACILASIVPYGQEILYFNQLRTEPLNSIFLFLTYGGEIWAYLLFGTAVLFWRPKFALIIALTGLLAIPVMYLLKDAIGVDRPLTFFEKRSSLADIVLVPNADTNRGQTSFPSGHTMAAFALFSLLSRMTASRNPKWGWVFAMLAILVGISRIFLVQHFLIDVIAGAILGLLLGELVWQASQRFLPSGLKKV